MTSRYVSIPADAVPANARFDVPRRNQGQIVEVAYAAWPRSAAEADVGDKFQRRIDRSSGQVEHFKRAR